MRGLVLVLVALVPATLDAMPSGKGSAKGSSKKHVAAKTASVAPSEATAPPNVDSKRSPKPRRPNRPRSGDMFRTVFEHRTPCTSDAEVPAAKPQTPHSANPKSARLRTRRARAQWVVVPAPRKHKKTFEQQSAARSDAEPPCCFVPWKASSAAKQTAHKTSSSSGVDALDTPRGLDSPSCVVGPPDYESSSSFEPVPTDGACTTRARTRRGSAGSTEEYDVTGPLSSSDDPDVSMPSSEDSLSGDLCPVRCAQSKRPKCVPSLDILRVPRYGDKRLQWSARCLATVRP